MKLILNVVERQEERNRTRAGTALSTPRSDGFRMPAEWAPHERTLMAWPAAASCGARSSTGQGRLCRDRQAVAAFEPLTMVCADAQDAARGARRLPGDVDVVELRSTTRGCATAARSSSSTGTASAPASLRLQRLGWEVTPYDEDAAVGGRLLARLGRPPLRRAVRARGRLDPRRRRGHAAHHRAVPAAPQPQPGAVARARSRRSCALAGRRAGGVAGAGPAEDRDTDGHVDLIASFTRPGEVLAQRVPPGTPNIEHLADNPSRLSAADSTSSTCRSCPRRGRRRGVAVSHLNLTCATAPRSCPSVAPAARPRRLSASAPFPGREVVPVPGGVLAFGGGGPHCITQQVPARGT